MADSEVLKKLKHVPFKIQTASLKERREVIKEIQDVLATPGITEPAVRFICRVVTSTLHRYRDTTSQFYVKTLLAYLCTNHCEWTLRSFLPLLLDISETLRNTVTSKSTCQSGLFALHWSAVVTEASLKITEDAVDYNSLVLSQANFLSVVTAYGNKKKNNKAFTALHISWKAIGKTKTTNWFDVLTKLPADTGPQIPIIFSALCRHFKQTGDEETVISHKVKMLDSFIKSLISVKNRPNANYISACADLLHMLTLDDVKGSLLPALQKAMLRSPETIIQAVGEVFANLELFVDGTAVDIGKSLIGNLHSKEAWARAEASTALGHLARRCCALAAARALLAAAFAEYHGAGGKLASSEDKIAVLQGAGTLSELAVNEEDFKVLYEEVTNQVARVLDSESHERTLCVALDVLSLWTQRLRAPLHPKVYEVFKKNLSAKNSTPAVRGAYVALLSRALRGGVAAEHAQALRPTLLSALERAAAQPLQAIVNEAISAMLGLILMDEDRQLPSKTAVWSLLVHPDKHVLLQDRVLAAAPDEVVTQVVLVCGAALARYGGEARDAAAPPCRALVLALLAAARPVRAAALLQLTELLAGEDRAHLARSLALKLNEVLDEGKIFISKEKSPPAEKAEVTGKMILDCVHAICSYRDYPSEEVEGLALDILPSCHHPLAAACGGARAWLRLLAHLRLQPRDLVARHCTKLKATYIDGYTPTPTMSNIVSSLVAANPEALGGAALAAALGALREPDLLRVTRDEYFVFLTPPGDLYDKTVVPGNDDNREMNLKRESKAYSYKEQLEELQLRRELEEQRRCDGHAKQVPLTAKQKEAIKLQLAKESIIRDRLTALNERVVVAEQLVSAVQAGSAAALCQQARHVVSAVLAALRSPLAAPRLAPLYLRLRPALLPGHALLGDTAARVALRLHKPQCDLESCWEEEELGKATVRTIGLLHAATAMPKPSAEPASPPAAPASPAPPALAPTHAAPNHFTAPGFCYIFPLLKQGLTGAARADEAAMVNGLTVIARHARLRGQPHDPHDLLRPALLPIDHMFRLLIDVISSTSKRVQAAATLALLETAECAARGDLSLDDATCLLAGLQNPLEVVRDAALRALLCVADCLSPLLDDLEHGLEITKRLYIATFDISEDNKKLAYELWSRVGRAEAWLSGAQVELVRELVREVQHPSEPVQRAAAAALATLVARADSADCAPSRVMQMLHDLYEEKYPLIPAKLDQFGHEREAAVDEWGARRGAALGLRALAPRLAAADVPPATAFFVKRGLADRRGEVREEMLAAAMAVVELHGKETLSSQLPVFENFLDTAPKSGGFDAVRQCVVLLVGSLARHLEPHDARIRPITLRLVAALSTPSQPVQEAVSNCLPHLVTSPALAAEIQPIMNKLMKQLLTAEKYGDRRGAAYGIAGVIKGLGILSLKQLDVMTKLTDAIQEKKNYKYREGALFGFEVLCCKLGRLFEPYIVHVLPHLLMCFGDNSQYVRAAADDTAKLIMSKLSAHGVKLVLPSLLQALQDDNWRTKAGSIELLGAMAYCAPKQLSSCLPSIVPKLIEVLSDSHTKVQEASVEALGVIGSVIRNPEIQAIVPVLLHALKDPSNMTSACLQTLLDTKFVHFIDAPSLALIMPVVQRAFQDRSTETRKMAAQIIGNMYSLTDQKDLLPYLPNIIPGLKSSLLDPVPEVRSVSARALGAMVRGMGENSFEELLPWLMQTLTSESSSVDRSGAAQGLSEVVAGLGVEKLHKLMPDIIATAERTDIAPHVKDGYIMMFIYMPGAFTDEFTPYIGQIINPILKALADENEYVRETALKAGQRIVTLYAESAIALLLPQLEHGLFDDNWRIRYSSVQLLGDLLYRISGVSGKMSTETASEDDNFGTEHSHRAIMSALGTERRNRVLAGLYMGRSDVALMVRQAALHVWKVVVTNTPKTLREILPTLFGLLLGCLASTSYDKRQVAARTLGDLVRKLGERVLPEIVPILERGLRSERADQRQGVCIGLGEILASTSRDAVLSFADGLVPTVRTALCDPLPEVRMAAARTFDSLHATIGNKALDDILPPMLAQLHHEDPQRADAALDGLKQVMAIKSRAVLPYLIPRAVALPAARAARATGRAGGGARLLARGPRARPLPRRAPARSRRRRCALHHRHAAGGGAHGQRRAAARGGRAAVRLRVALARRPDAARAAAAARTAAALRRQRPRRAADGVGGAVRADAHARRGPADPARERRATGGALCRRRPPARRPAARLLPAQGHSADPAAVPRGDIERSAGGQGERGVDAGRSDPADVGERAAAVRGARHRPAHPHSRRPLQRRRQGRRARDAGRAALQGGRDAETVPAPAADDVPEGAARRQPHGAHQGGAGARAAGADPHTRRPALRGDAQRRAQRGGRGGARDHAAGPARRAQCRRTEDVGAAGADSARHADLARAARAPRRPPARRRRRLPGRAGAVAAGGTPRRRHRAPRAGRLAGGGLAATARPLVRALRRAQGEPAGGVPRAVPRSRGARAARAPGQRARAARLQRRARHRLPRAPPAAQRPPAAAQPARTVRQEHEPLEQRGEAADGAGERAAGPRGAAGGVRRRAAARAAARARQRHQGEEHLCPRQLGARPARRAAPAARRTLPPEMPIAAGGGRARGAERRGGARAAPGAWGRARHSRPRRGSRLHAAHLS